MSNEDPTQGPVRWRMAFSVDQTIRALVEFSGEVFLIRQGDPATAIDPGGHDIEVTIRLVDEAGQAPFFAPPP